MHAHYLQHVPFEGLGIIEPWLTQAGYEITNTRFFETTELPSIREIDLLIIMGGPMSVNDEDELPWLIQEKQFIRSVIQTGKPVLGVCLGAQLIASAMGARVYRNHEKEIGWFPVQGIDKNEESIFQFPKTVNVFHWHGETFDLPSGAVQLARSEACENQAFQLGNSVIGIQFHLETTPESLLGIVINCKSELKPSKYVQTESVIIKAAPEKYNIINSLMGDVLTFILKKSNSIQGVKI